MSSTKVHKRMSFLVSLCMLMCLVLPAIPAAAAADLDGHWAQKEMESFIEKGIVSGYPDGSYKPDKTITRAEFVKMLNQAAQLKDVPAVGFNDVSSGDWFSGAIGASVQAGYVSGYPDGSFRPNATIARQEAAVMLSGLLRLEKSQSGTAQFTDLDKIADWALPDVLASTQAGAISGYPGGSFGPDKGMTRAETVVMISRVSERLVATPPSEQPQQPAVVQLVKVTNNTTAAANAVVNINAAGKRAPVFTGQTNVNGEATSQLQPGNYEITATKAGLTAYQSVTVGTTPAPLTLALTQGASLQGQVVDGAGKALARALVIASSGQGVYYALSDSNGNYTLQVLPGQSYQLRVIYDATLSSTLSEAEVVKQFSSAVDWDSSTTIATGSAKLFVFDQTVASGAAGSSVTVGKLTLNEDTAVMDNPNTPGSGGSGGSSSRDRDDNRVVDAVYGSNGLFTALTRGGVITFQGASAFGPNPDAIIDSNGCVPGIHVFAQGAHLAFAVDIQTTDPFLSLQPVVQIYTADSQPKLLRTLSMHYSEHPPGAPNAPSFWTAGLLLSEEWATGDYTYKFVVNGKYAFTPGNHTFTVAAVDNSVVNAVYGSNGLYTAPTRNGVITFEGASIVGPNPDAIMGITCIPGMHDYEQGKHLAFGVDIQSTEGTLSNTNIKPVVQIFSADSNPVLLKTFEMGYSVHPPGNPNGRFFWTAGLILGEGWATGDYTYKFIVNGKYVFTPNNNTLTIR